MFLAVAIFWAVSWFALAAERRLLRSNPGLFASLAFVPAGGREVSLPTSTAMSLSRSDEPLGYRQMPIYTLELKRLKAVRVWSECGQRGEFREDLSGGWIAARIGAKVVERVVRFTLRARRGSVTMRAYLWPGGLFMRALWCVILASAGATGLEGGPLAKHVGTIIVMFASLELFVCWTMAARARSTVGDMLARLEQDLKAGGAFRSGGAATVAQPPAGIDA